MTPAATLPHRSLGLAALGATLGLGLAGAALAAPEAPTAVTTGQPLPWQMGLQYGHTELARAAADFHNWITWLMGVVTVFVAGLLLYAVWRFSEKRNPVPSRTTHHTGIEIAWTIAPVLILVLIAVPSFRLLTKQLVIPAPDVVIKATGVQWYWDYEYPADQGGIKFSSIMLTDEQRAKMIGEGRPAGDLPRNLSVDNELVVPVNKIVKMQVTGGDVLHSFAMPSFGIKMDAVPGRLNETWFRAEREGVYYGQCSELCGVQHAFMPIQIRVVSEQRYAEWLGEAKKQFASDGTPTRLAGAADQGTSTQDPARR